MQAENKEVQKESQKKAGRPKGALGLNKIEEGKIIEIVQPTEQANEEPPIPISFSAAKKLIRKPSKPRVISDEQKKKMLENLAKGREKRLQMFENKKNEMKQEEEKAKKELVIKKYIVKPKRVVKRKFQQEESEKETSAIETEDFTDAGTDMEIYKKIKRQERLLKKIQKIKEDVPEPQPQPPAKKVIRIYNPFY
jgi:hypothetical protein